MPLVNTSLAKAVPLGISKLEKPKNAIDKEPIFAYVENLEASGSVLKLKSLKNGQYQISGDLQSGELILVQMAYAAGWHARDGRGKNLEIKADPLGFILIKPQNPGEQQVTLTYAHPLGVKFGWALTAFTFATMIVLLVRQRGMIFMEKMEKKPAGMPKEAPDLDEEN